MQIAAQGEDFSRVSRRLLALALWSLFAAAHVDAQYVVLHDFAPQGGGPRGPLTLAEDGTLYGTAEGGGTLAQGSVFKLVPQPGGGYEYAQLYSFSGPDGSRPSAGLLLIGGALYGTTETGGSLDLGTIFRLDDTGTLTVLHSFSGGDGSSPAGALVEAAPGIFLGTTAAGGAFASGTIFSVDTDGFVSTVHEFEGGPGGAWPQGGLTAVGDGTFFGTTLFGGFGSGSIYRLELDQTVTTIHTFDAFSEGAHPYGSLVWDGDATLFGTTNDSGGFGFGYGTVFSITLDGAYTVLHVLNNGGDGSYPFAGVTRRTDGALFGTTSSGGANMWGTLYRLDPGGAFSVLVNFGLPEANQAIAAPTLLPDGALAGTAMGGGSAGAGVVYRFEEGGALSILHSFGTLGGTYPLGQLFEGGDGYLYGTTSSGGAGGGTVFRCDLSGLFEYLHLFAFDGADGASPFGALTLGPEGSLFGTTYTGGAEGLGTIFRIDSSGAYTQTHSLVESEGGSFYDGLTWASDLNLFGVASAMFGSALRSPDGVAVESIHTFTTSEGRGIFWKLAEGSDGNLYGTANGVGSRGTLYRMSLSGEVELLHEFAGAEGEAPAAGLVRAGWDRFYGVNATGYSTPSGTVFEADMTGRVRVLHVFGGPDGASPVGLFVGTGGELFGATYAGGANGAGTIIQIDRYGNTVKLHDFSPESGMLPASSVIEASDGNLYGTTFNGGFGGFGRGVLFRLSLPVRVFSLDPPSGDAMSATTTLTGRGFGDGSGVSISGIPVGILDSSPSEILVATPTLPPGTLNDVVVTNPDGVGTLTLGWLADFLDVAQADLFHADVEKVFRHHIAVGIGGGLFGRNDPVTRAQIAVLLVKTAHGAAFVPAPCAGLFDDVSCPGPFTNWIEEASREQWTAGCQQAPALYCPTSSVTRAQFAVLLLKALRGSAFQPPACQGVFEDVACPGGFAADWIEELYNEGISTGCNASPALYCPDSPTSRGQAAVLLSRSFQLP